MDKNTQAIRESFATAIKSQHSPANQQQSSNNSSNMLLASSSGNTPTKSATSSTQGRQGNLTSEGHAEEWKSMGVVPINYELARMTLEHRDTVQFGFSRDGGKEESLDQEDKQLEALLFGEDGALMHGTRLGTNYDGVMKVQVTKHSEADFQPLKKDFNEKAGGLHPQMLWNIKMCGYDYPTPIQKYTLPAIAQGKDLLATAQTGSGKTGAYLIPTINQLMGKVDELAHPRHREPVVKGTEWTPEMKTVAHPLILILVPTRELAIQVFNEARRFCYRSKIRPCVIYGGGPKPQMREDLRKGCELLIATPGRLLDMCREQNTMSLSKLIYTVFDEADELFKDDWATDLQKIMFATDRNNSSDAVSLMFSATFSRGTAKLAYDFLASDHVRIRVGKIGSIAYGVRQKVISVSRDQRDRALLDLFETELAIARTLVFVNYKGVVDRVDDLLHNEGMPVAGISSDRSQAEREDADRLFRLGKVKVLVTTDMKGRGMDYYDCLQVINYEMPKNITTYVHRCGRTGRIGNDGTVYSFFDEDRDQDIGPGLVKVMLESGQDIPEFLQVYKPDEDDLGFGETEFDPPSDDEDDGSVTPTPTKHTAPEKGDTRASASAPATAAVDDEAW